MRRPGRPALAGFGRHLLEVVPEAAVSTPEGRRDRRPHQRVPEPAAGLEHQDVGEHGRAVVPAAAVRSWRVCPWSQLIEHSRNLPFSNTSTCSVRRSTGTRPHAGVHVAKRRPTTSSGGVWLSRRTGKVIFANGHSSSLAPLTATTRSQTKTKGAASSDSKRSSIDISPMLARSCACAAVPRGALTPGL